MAGHFPRKRYVSLGGGTGQSQVIRALRMLDCEISAVVAMADDGGSTGVIRREMGVVPPGDVRNCLVALAADPMGPVARAFQRRLPVASDHALGNLILATLDEECDSFVDAIEMCERMLGCVGSVLPSTQEFVALRGITCDGRPISGEELIGTSPCTIGRVCLEPERPEACPEAVAAILSADVIVMGPGSLFTSIIPNVLVPGIARALHDTSATRIFVCPKADTQYETWGLTADEYVRALYDHGAARCTTRRPPGSSSVPRRTPSTRPGVSPPTSTSGRSTTMAPRAAWTPSSSIAPGRTGAPRPGPSRRSPPSRLPPTRHVARSTPRDARPSPRTSCRTSTMFAWTMPS